MRSGELVVCSHLRWDWVWQRPQHLLSRLSAQRAVWFVEEPRYAEVGQPILRSQQSGQVTRVWLEVPAKPTVGGGGAAQPHLGFESPQARCYGSLLAEMIGPAVDRLGWLYSPLALDLLTAVQPDVVVYDLMDDLASFAGAPPAMALAHHRALRRADVVFTGGRSLHRAATALRTEDVHLFPSGVDPAHYARAVSLRHRRQLGPPGGGRGRHGCGGAKVGPVAGYVGVIDERVDLGLVAELAWALPDWDIHMVGPVAKIDPASLPAAANLHYAGAKPYAELPAVMAGFDVALMPFARNDATRSISPTKTLEYLAAGLPVVSTAVPDVVADDLPGVAVHNGAPAMAAACRRALEDGFGHRAAEVRALLRRRSWDAIAAQMWVLIERARFRRASAAASDLGEEVGT